VAVIAREVWHAKTRFAFWHLPVGKLRVRSAIRLLAHSHQAVFWADQRATDGGYREHYAVAPDLGLIDADMVDLLAP
jgi:hypothetical protein